MKTRPDSAAVHRTTEDTNTADAARSPVDIHLQHPSHDGGTPPCSFSNLPTSKIYLHSLLSGVPEFISVTGESARFKDP